MLNEERKRRRVVKGGEVCTKRHEEHKEDCVNTIA